MDILIEAIGWSKHVMHAYSELGCILVVYRTFARYTFLRMVWVSSRQGGSWPTNDRSITLTYACHPQLNDGIMFNTQVWRYMQVNCASYLCSGLYSQVKYLNFRCQENWIWIKFISNLTEQLIPCNYMLCWVLGINCQLVVASTLVWHWGWQGDRVKSLSTHSRCGSTLSRFIPLHLWVAIITLIL